MSDNTEPTGEYNPPTEFVKFLGEVDERERELDEKGVMVETECERCDDSLEVDILPDESTGGHICQACLVYALETSNAL